MSTKTIYISPFLREFLVKYPKAQLVSNQSVKDLLLKEQIVVTTSRNQFISFQPLAHEKALNFLMPANWGITLFNELLHPGDSLQFTRSPQNTCTSFQGPWTV